MVIAAYGAMAIWCRRPVLVWIVKVPDGAVDVGKLCPPKHWARSERSAAALRGQRSRTRPCGGAAFAADAQPMAVVERCGA